MATEPGIPLKNANAAKKSDWKNEVALVSYMTTQPILHTFKKPSWAKERSALDIIEPVEYKSPSATGAIWKSAMSFPMLLLLAFPLLAVFALTSIHYGAFPDSMTPYMFKASQGDPRSPALVAGSWAVALIAFVPWSASVCRLESWVSKYLQ